MKNERVATVKREGEGKRNRQKRTCHRGRPDSGSGTESKGEEESDEEDGSLCVHDDEASDDEESSNEGSSGQSEDERDEDDIPVRHPLLQTDVGTTFFIQNVPRYDATNDKLHRPPSIYADCDGPATCRSRGICILL